MKKATRSVAVAGLVVAVGGGLFAGGVEWNRRAAIASANAEEQAGWDADNANVARFLADADVRIARAKSGYPMSDVEVATQDVLREMKYGKKH